VYGKHGFALNQTLSESFHPSKGKKGTGKGYRPTCMRMHLKAGY